MHIETITYEGRKLAVLPVKQLKQLLDDAEMLSDIGAYDLAKARVELEKDEIIPFELVERRVGGENAVKIWREYRGLTQEKLSGISGISRAMIAAIEAGTKKGSVSTLKKISAALEVSLEQLV
mgnify:CR=1 FL=1